MTCLVYETGFPPKPFRWEGRDEFRHTGQYIKITKLTGAVSVSDDREGNWSDDKFWDDTEQWGVYSP